MSTKAVLLRARELLADPAHWIQGEYAHDKYGNACTTVSPDAIAWCFEGALIRAINDVSPNFTINTTHLGFATKGGLVVWNDAPGRAHAEVLDRLDTAIQNTK